MHQRSKGDPQYIRSMNRRLVIDALRRKGEMSRADLVRDIGLEPSTISSIVKEFIKEDLVQVVGEGLSTGGRRPIMLSLNHDYGHTIGAKIEAQRVLTGLVSLDGQLVHVTEADYPRGSKPGIVLKALEKSVEQLPATDHLIGVGIGISGFVHSFHDQLKYSPILGWRNEDLRTPLNDMFDCPVFFSNDVNAFALGEKWHGVGKQFKNFICVTVGEGIGAGIYIEGHLYEGSHGGAGELGHTCIQLDGPLCRCGQHGCLEALASDDFLTREASDQKLPQDVSKLVALAHDGDRKALKIFNQMGRHLGVGLKSLITLLDPEAIIVGGERVDALDLFKDAMREELVHDSFSHWGDLEIVPAQLGESGWLIGAATLPLRARFTPVGGS